jgi:hypothetical protein
MLATWEPIAEHRQSRRSTAYIVMVIMSPTLFLCQPPKKELGDEKKKPGKEKYKKLTARPHARAGSMEVDGHENPDAGN